MNQIMYKRTKMIPYQVDTICPHCNMGTLHVIDTHSTNPPTFLHECGTCKEKILMSKKYPHIEHVDAEVQ